MKLNIEIDCTPAEARAFLGLPDVTGLNDHLVAEMQKRMDANMAAADANMASADANAAAMDANAAGNAVPAARASRANVTKNEWSGSASSAGCSTPIAT